MMGPRQRLSLVAGRTARAGRLRACFALAAALAACAAALPQSATAQDPPQIELRLNRVETYIPKSGTKRRMNHLYRSDLDRMVLEMQARMKAGENLVCTAQIAEEAHWLINYTDRGEEVEGRLEDMRAALDEGTVAPVQDPADGSFGACLDSWLWRFFKSVDPLKELARDGKKPEIPLKIWEPVDTPEEIEALMRDLLVSDLSTGHDKRKELNLAITALGQLLWRDATAAVFPEHLDREALAEALRRFVDDEWQDSDTGYWGAWYREEGEIHRTNDLSITFHVLSYRDGKIERQRELANTTFAIRNMPYPFGWATGGTQNNHHAYDIARIVNYTRDDVDLVGRAFGGSVLFLMTSRSLAHSIDENGAFDSAPYTSVGEAYYFGISFFEEVGVIGNLPRDDRLVRISNTDLLLEQIERNLDTLDPADPWVPAARRKLGDLRM